MRLVDVHAHLDMEQFSEDLDEVIDEAREQGVKLVIANGVDKESNREVLKISDKYEIVKPALGVYPNDALEMGKPEFEEELEFIKEQELLAIGEIGLDYKEEVDKDLMKERFEAQLELAKELDVPVIVHSRKAEEDVIELIEEVGNTKVVMHCFSGSKKLIERARDNGWYFSIPCIVTYLEHFQMLVDMTPLKQLLTETDAPFMSPYPNKSRNEPAFVIESLQKIAEIKGLDVEEAANQVFMNYQKLFL